MKVLLTIWVSAVLIQEVFPSTLVRLPRQASNKTSLVHTEYEAKYQQKGKHGNESFSSVSGKQHFMHDNCSENWNAFAEKCASLIKDLVASLANVVSSKPGDATNLQLHIKNTFRHFDNTHNCTCLNHCGKGLSDIDLSPFFNNITITTVGPGTNAVGGSGSGTNKAGQDNCGGSCDKESDSHLKPVVVSPSSNINGGDNNKADHNGSQKCSDDSCAGHHNNAEKGTEEQAIGDPTGVPLTRRISNALADTENPDMHPSTAGNSNDQPTTNGRRQAKYPQVSRQPENLIYSPGDSDYLIYPKHPKNSEQVLHPFLVTPRPSYPAKSSQAPADPVSVVFPVKKTVPLTMTPETNSNSNLPESSAPENGKVKSVNSLPVKPLPGSVQPNAVSVDPDDCQSESQQPQVNLLTTPINFYPVKTTPVMPADTDKQQENPTDCSGDDNQELYNEFPKIHKKPESLSQQGCGDDCKDAKAPSTDNLVTDIPGTVFTGPKEKHGSAPAMLKLVKPNVLPISKVQTGGAPLGYPSHSLGQPAPLGQQLLPDPLGQGANPLGLIPPPSGPDVIPTVLESVTPTEGPDCESQTGEGNPSGPSGQSGQMGPFGLPGHSGPGVTPAGLTPTGSDPSAIPTLLQSVTPTEGPDCESQTGEGNPSGPMGPFGLPGHSGPGVTKAGLTPTGSDPSVIPTLLQSVTPTEGPDCESQTGEGNPSGPMGPFGLPGHSGPGVTPAGLTPTGSDPSAIPTLLQSVTPTEDPDCESQTEGNPSGPLNHSGPMGPIGLPGQSGPGVTPVGLTPTGSDCESQTGEGNPSGPSGQSGQMGPFGLPGHSGPGVTPAGLTPTGSDPSVIPTLLQSVTPTEVPDCESQTGEGNPSGPLDHSGPMGPLGLPDPSGPGVTPVGLTPTGSDCESETGEGNPSGPLDHSGQMGPHGLPGHSGPGVTPAGLTPTGSDPSVIPTLLQSVTPTEGSDCESQTEGNPSGPLDHSGPMGPLGLPGQSGPGVTPIGLTPTGSDCESQTGEGNPPGPLDHSGPMGPLGLPGQSGPGVTPIGLTPIASVPIVIPTLLQTVTPTEGPDCESQTEEGNPSGPSGQSGQMGPLGLPGQSGPGVTPVGLIPTGSDCESQTGEGNPSLPPGQSGQGAIPGVLTPAQSGYAPGITELIKPVGVVPIAQGLGGPVGPSGQSVAPGHLGNLNQGPTPTNMKPEKSGITPVITEPITLVPKGNEQLGNDAMGEIPVLIRPTTFQTTSVEPTAPPALPVKSTKPVLDSLVPQDSYEHLPMKPSTSPKSPVPRDDDDDEDDEDCCSCESCEEEITDPKQFKENACKNLEEARKELKQIFDKIKKKLKCGRKAPRTITTQRIS